MNTSLGRSVEWLPVTQLLLDPANPRLPIEFDSGGAAQRDIAIYINKHYDPLRIAQSIADHKFFESEPLIAIREGATYRVLEGNRRLTALKGLNDAELRAAFGVENRGWNQLDVRNVPSAVPVLVVEDASEVTPLLGFRHISGIEPWDPYAQARYIAQLVDRDNYSLSEVAELVGRTRTEVSSKYRDFDILNQADELGLETKKARDAFGVFNNAMGRRAIRAFIGAPDPRSVDPAEYPLPDGNKENLRIVLDLIFGATSREAKVISDSRQLGQLAQVLADLSGRALRVLLGTKSLTEALDSLADPEDQYSRALSRAAAELRKALDLELSEVPTQSLVLIADVRQALSEIESLAGLAKK